MLPEVQFGHIILKGTDYNINNHGVDLVRNLNDWEIDEFTRLLQVLPDVLLENHIDKATWKFKKDDISIVKSFYEYLTTSRDDSLNHPVYQIWQVKAPPKITSFAWETSRESILTIDKPMRKDHTIVNCCYLSMETAESYNHLLLWCPMTYSLWHMVYSLLCINWVMGGSVKNEI